MEIKDMLFYTFRGEDPKTREDLVKCPECDEWSPLKDWVETDALYCDDCGNHYGAICPQCEESSDMVFTEFETKGSDSGSLG